MGEKAAATAAPEKTSHGNHGTRQNGELSSRPVSANPFVGLQQAIGNQAMLQLLEAGAIQAKLRISQPGDADEIEADRVAETIVSSSREPALHRKCSCAAGTSCPDCKEEQQGVVHRTVASPLLRSSGSHIQRSPADTSLGSTQGLTTPQTTPAARGTARPTQLVVEDDAKSLDPHQMRKSQFIALLRTDACATADAVLKSVGHSTESCPYISKWLSFYEKQSSPHIERALRKYAPETATARSAHEAIRLVVVRIQRAAITWARTGKIEGLPEELASQLTGQGGFLGAIHSFASSSVGGAVLGFIGGKSKQEDSGSGNVLRKPRNKAPAPTHDAAAVKGQLGTGQALDARVQSQMSSAFGHDFSGVRIHTDSRAATLSSDLQARAFTIGSDVAFAGGEYNPGTLIGDALIAHELAHVVQQAGANTAPGPMLKAEGEYNALERDADQSARGAVLSMWTGAKNQCADLTRRAAPHLRSGLKLQRCTRAAPGGPAPAPFEFSVRGKFQDSASFPNVIFFDENAAATLDAAEKAKIALLALPAGDMLTLNGFTSEESDPATKLAIINARLDAVAAELVARGHDPAKISKVPKPTDSDKRIDYRRMRSIEVLRPGSVSAVPSAGTPATAPCAGSEETNFVDAEGEAEAILAKAVTALGPPVDPGMAPLLTRFFPGWGPGDASTIKSNMGAISAQLHRLLPPANHQCAILKYAPCEAGTEAENIRSGAAAMMTMCPTFFAAGKSKKQRGGTLIHEASHGTPGLGTEDKSYAHERLIEFLPLADALKNADSYALLARLFDTPGSMHVGPPVPDPLTGGMSPGEEAAARRTIAWMEKWLIWSYQEMSSLYNMIHDSIVAGSWTNPYYRDTMGLVAPLFALTPPPAMPTKTDQFKVAAIYDRVHIMRSVEWGTAITINKAAAAAPDTWAAGPGNSVNLSPAFFADTPRGQLDRLLTAIAKATPDISASFVPKYVTLADKIRLHMGEGGPR
jgi:hypothetical protein